MDLSDPPYIKIANVPKYLVDNKHDISEVTLLVEKVVSYLRTFKVAPKHYSISINPDDRWIMIQIDEQCGYVDRQVSKSQFEFINGTCFSIEIDELNTASCGNTSVVAKKKISFE